MKRGPYKKTKILMVKDRPRNFFRPDHEHIGVFITWADTVSRDGGQVSVLYKIAGNKKQYRCPRYKTAWLDDKPADYAKMIVDDWKKSNNNSTGKGELLPDFYLQHRSEFIMWLGHTARHSTISGYESFLKTYVFPYFVEKLCLKSPVDWNNDSLARWENFLSEQIKQPSTRNRIRTSLRRYQRFLKSKNIIKSIPQIFNESFRRGSRETPIPGELPSWSDVIDWLKILPPGRYRFIRAVMKGFGLRISEACQVDQYDFFGAESEDHIDMKNDFIKELKDKKLISLFLYVNKAEKRKVSRDLIKLLGEQNIEPKSGPYTACCTNPQMAKFIVSLIENGEHLEELTKDQVYKVKEEMPIDDSPYKFHLYRPHDDRRLNITLQMFDLDVNDRAEICCQLHGQSSRDVFLRYFQWGLLQKRKQTKKDGAKLRVFENQDKIG